MAYTEIILTENLPPLGAEADIVRVRRGYARNFLIPQGKAREVTAATLRTINHLKAKRSQREAREQTAAAELAARINKLRLNLTLETGGTGKAFGAITAKDLTERIEAELKDVTLPKHAVALDRGIKETGEHEVEVRLHHDVTAKLKFKVITAAAGEQAAAAAQESETKRPRKKTTKS